MNLQLPPQTKNTSSFTASRAESRVPSPYGGLGLPRLPYISRASPIRLAPAQILAQWTPCATAVQSAHSVLHDSAPVHGTKHVVLVPKPPLPAPRRLSWKSKGHIEPAYRSCLCAIKSLSSLHSSRFDEARDALVERSGSRPPPGSTPMTWAVNKDARNGRTRCLQELLQLLHRSRGYRGWVGGGSWEQFTIDPQAVDPRFIPCVESRAPGKTHAPCHLLSTLEHQLFWAVFCLHCLRGELAFTAGATEIVRRNP